MHPGEAKPSIASPAEVDIECTLLILETSSVVFVIVKYFFSFFISFSVNMKVTLFVNLLSTNLQLLAVSFTIGILKILS